MTTGTKAQIVQRVFEHEHECSDTHCPTTEANAYVAQNVPLNNAEKDPSAPIKEAINQPFSSGQLNQLCQLIAEAVGLEHRGPAVANANGNNPFFSPAILQAKQLQFPQDLTREGNQDGLLTITTQDPRPPTGNAADG